MPASSGEYRPEEIEPKAQALWERRDNVQTRDDAAEAREKRFYCLDMFPYPSGEGLHVGHVEGYTATDMYARYLRMRGFDVLHPMGWDAFGLPAENTAIKLKVHPQILVEQNVERFRQQLRRLGFSYDWSREINTTDPAYYRWTQWIFLKLFHLGLAYEAEVPINWCPSCKTGLANEEVIDGRCERCGTTVTKKNLRQWMLHITKYADRLLRDLDALDWPEGIKELQRNWIGRSEGTEVVFKTADSAHDIPVFTTRADTLFGATYMVLAPEHPLVETITTPERREAVLQYTVAARGKSDLERTAFEKEKTGVDTGAKAINLVNGEEIPIWVADYVLATYGTGAIMAVPAHDERDFEFAKKFDLPIRDVIVEQINQRVPEGVFRKIAIGIIENEKDEVLIQSHTINGITTYGLPGGGVDEGESEEQAVIREVREETGYQNFTNVRRIGTVEANYYNKIHKINRQALATCYAMLLQENLRTEPTFTKLEKQGGIQHAWMDKYEAAKQLAGPDASSDEDFPLFRRYLYGKTSAYAGEGILIHSGAFDGLSTNEARAKIASKFGTKKTTYKLRDWVFSRQRYWGEPIPIVHCAACGVVPVPEDHLPVLLPDVASYEPTGTGASPLAVISDWVNTTCPQCAGPAKRETNTMPQWAGSCWYFLKFASQRGSDGMPWSWDVLERWLPVDLYVGGAEHAVLHLLYARFWMKALYDGGYVPVEEPFQKLRNQGTILGPDGQKMSKSRGNVVNPDVIVAQYGADTLRLYEMFLGPLEASKPWDPKSVPGVHRFLKRVWRLGGALQNESRRAGSAAVQRALHRLVKKVGEDIEALKFNTAIAAMMEFLNLAEKEGVGREDFRTFLIVLSPFAPHLAEELWQQLSQSAPRGAHGSVTQQSWPPYDSSLIEEARITIVVQVNGKPRAEVVVTRDASEAEVRAAAEGEPRILKWIGGKRIQRAIVVPHRLVNFVLGD